MRFDLNKIFKGESRQKSIVSMEEVGRLFTGATGWGKGAQLEQYSKSLYVFAAVNKIAQKVAGIDIQLFKILGKTGDTEEILNHEILDLLMKINPFQTRSEFLRIAWINKKLTGEAFWLKVRNNSGHVIELWNLRPDFVTVVADPQKYIKHYRFNKLDGSTEIILPEDMVFIKDPNPLDYLRGISPVVVSGSRIETESLATRYQRNFFNNNARPDALLITEEMLDTEQRSQMVSSWNEKHSGDGKSSKIGILEGGMKYQQVSISQKEMDYIESLKFTRDDILVAFGVPKSVITTDDVNYANGEAGIRSFLAETIKPEMDQLVEVLNEMLVSPEYGEEFFLDHVDPTPEDRTSLRDDSSAAFGKWMTTNEIRHSYNLPEIEGGDVIVQATQQQQPAIVDGSQPTKKELTRRRMLALKHLQGRPTLRIKFDIADIMEKGLAAPIKVKTKNKKVKESFNDKEQFISLMPDADIRNKYYEYVNKKLDKKSVDFRNMLVKEFALQEDRVLKSLDELDKTKTVYEKISQYQVSLLMDKKAESSIFSAVALPFLVDYAKEGGEDAALLVGESFDMTDELRKAIEKRSSFFAESVTDTTFTKLTRTLSEGINGGEGIRELTNRVREVYSEIPEWRANTIARTETTNANNEGMLDAFRSSKVIKGKEWIATMDFRTRDSHSSLNGQIVDVDAVFGNGLRYPGDMGPADETINCRCVIAPALFEKGKSVGALKKKEFVEKSPKCRQSGETKKKCMSRKIPELVNEGYSQDQAVAIAASVCSKACGVKGGAGSGNWNHAGRPGTVGGSSNTFSARAVGIASVPKQYEEQFNSMLTKIEENGLPADALNGLSEIKVLSGQQMSLRYKKAVAVGLYSLEEKKLYINGDSLGTNVTINARTLTHEIGHHVMESQMSKSVQASIFAIHSKDPESGLGDYASSNFHERFAEVFKYKYDGGRGSKMIANIESDINAIIDSHFNN